MQLTQAQERSLVSFYYFRDAKSINGNAYEGLVKAGLISQGTRGRWDCMITAEGEFFSRMIIQRQTQINAKNEQTP